MSVRLPWRNPEEFGFIYEAFGNIKRTTAPAQGGGTVVGESSTGGGSSGGYVVDADNDGLSPAFRAALVEWNTKIHVLEAFNGQYFFDLPETAGGALQITATGLREGSSTHSGASVLLGGPARIFVVSYSQAQLELLQQGYDALKKSVYEALVVQGHLQTYLDAVQLTIGVDGIEFDFSAMEAMLHQEKEVALCNPAFA